MTDTILMIRPVAFRRNEETVENNYFQKEKTRVLPKTMQTKALKEFNALVEKLEKIGLNVIIVDDTTETDTPDSIFPNNWISFHESGTVCIYPMFAENRRLERREEVLKVVESNGFKIKNIIDYSSAEEENVFLEGTGSFVLDRQNKIAYCALSPRSNETLFIEFCEDLEYTPILFRAHQTVANKQRLIYHTNVMMSIGDNFALICLQAISNKKERKQVISMLDNSNKEIIIINKEQVNHFAGNILQVTAKDKKYIVMSTTAYKSLSKAQIKIIEKHGEIISSDVSAIENYGGGSVRCMLTEIYS